MNFSRLRALTFKEFRQIKRDPSSFLIAVIFPIMLLFLYGYGVSLDLNHLKIGIDLQDRSLDARSFGHALESSPYFSCRFDHQENLVPLLESGAIHGIVVVPSYFEKWELSKKGAPIYVIADGQNPNTASFVQQYVFGAWKNWQSAQDRPRKISSLIRPQPRYWYNEELSSHYFLIPGSIALIMTLVGSLLTALVIAREWERGTLEGLFSTPMRMNEFLLSKMAAYFCLGVLSMLFCFFGATIIFQVPFRGSYLSLSGVASLFLIASLAGGLLISSFARDQFIASQIAIMSSFLPAYSLSGFIFEISSMPSFIQLITTIIPAKYFVSSLQTLFLAGNISSVIVKDALALFLLSLVPLFITWKRSKKRLC